jgi:SAM-dependent methyltransferase
VNAPPLSPMATLRWAVTKPMLAELSPRRVFEVGCGQGGFGARIAATGAQYVGVEPDQTSFSVASERIEPLGGRVLNGTSDLVDATEQFDLICAFEVIEHLPDDRHALVDWTRRLAPGGHVVVSVPAWPDRFGSMDALVGHYRRYAPDQLDELFRSMGYLDVRHVLYGWPLGYVLEAGRNIVARRRGSASEDSMTSRSATSGRLFQPKRALGTAIRWGTWPFAAIQRLRPETGVGLVAVARKPA